MYLYNMCDIQFVIDRQNRNRGRTFIHYIYSTIVVDVELN